MNLDTPVAHSHSPHESLNAPVVFVVDSDASVREELSSLISSAGWQPRTIASAEEFIACPPVLTPSCLLVELDLPGLSGLDLQEHLLGRTEMPIIFMSSHADVRATVQAMKKGALEFLAKPFAYDVLLSAIRDAIERSRVAMRRLAQLQELRERYESLTRREREVMSLVVGGRLNKQVGGELGISEVTVKAHRGKMMRKMRAASFAELVRIAANLCRIARAGAVDLDIPAESANAATSF
jgi:FixJ family two-component response regulator